MGPYCGCRFLVDRVLADDRPMLLATCAKGMEHDRSPAGHAVLLGTRSAPGTRWTCSMRGCRLLEALREVR